MLYRFQNGTILELTTMEDIKNVGIYVVDEYENKIRYAKNEDEYLLNKVVLVNDFNFEKRSIINKGLKCRCWIVYLTLHGDNNGRQKTENKQLKERIAELEKECNIKRDITVDLLKKQEFYEQEKLKQFAERLKIESVNKIHETLKEFIGEKDNEKAD